MPLTAALSDRARGTEVRLSTARSCASDAILAMGLNARSVTFLGGVASGRFLIHAWLSGWSRPERLSDLRPSVAR